ncbi:MAG: ParA family protein [Chloroflexi bacterium]|nr:ParA family protein [Chloroflexota bacterium]
MGRVIAVANQKGGSGKTTTTRSLGSALAQRGKRVLMVDADPQGSLTEGCGLPLHLLEKTTYHVLIGAARLSEIIVSIEPNLDLAPANIHLCAAELQLVNMNRREDKLRNALKVVKDHYHYALLDCPPSFGLLTVNALSAADSVLIPMTCDYYTMLGVRLMLESIKDIQAEVNPQLKVEGILPTRYDSRTLHAKEILEQTRTALGREYRVYNVVVRESVRLKESPISGRSILDYAPNSDGSKSYRQLAKEIDNGQAN